MKVFRNPVWEVEEFPVSGEVQDWQRMISWNFPGQAGRGSEHSVLMDVVSSQSFFPPFPSSLGNLTKCQEKIQFL